MGQSYFIFNGRDCREMGVRLTGPMPIIRPEERAEHVQIPGRAGDLTRLEGDDIYNSYIQTAEISVQGGLNVRNVFNWLKGAGYLTTSSEPDRRQMARVIGAITLDKVSKNLDIWRGSVQFYCQPFKELLWEQTETLTAAGHINNNGDVISKPEWRITASAATLTFGSAWIDENGDTQHEAFEITGLTAGQVIVVDSDSMTITNADGTAVLSQYAAGDFPRLHVGDNYVSGTGWSSVTVTKRERYL